MSNLRGFPPVRGSQQPQGRQPTRLAQMSSPSLSSPEASSRRVAWSTLTSFHDVDDDDDDDENSSGADGHDGQFSTSSGSLGSTSDRLLWARRRRIETVTPPTIPPTRDDGLLADHHSSRPKSSREQHDADKKKANTFGATAMVNTATAPSPSATTPFLPRSPPALPYGSSSTVTPPSLLSPSSRPLSLLFFSPHSSRLLSSTLLPSLRG